MNEVFNSPFEAGLRTLLILYTLQPKSATIDRIAAYDFITIYGKIFNVSNFNLHGDSNLKFSELSSKRTNCRNGLKEFVLNGLISIRRSENGISYYLNSHAKKFVESLSSDYVAQYLATAKNVQIKFGNFSDVEIINIINNTAVRKLRGCTL